MKTASYVLREDQIEYVKECAEAAGSSTVSAAMRKILDASMQKRVVMVKGLNGVRVDPSFLPPVTEQDSTEGVS